MTPRVEIVQLDPAVLRCLAEGDQAAAERTSPVPLSPYLAGPDCRRVWEIRTEQVVEDPSSAAWITGIVWDPERELAVGRAGFHGPPDADGMVEVGYSHRPAVPAAGLRPGGAARPARTGGGRARRPHVPRDRLPGQRRLPRPGPRPRAGRGRRAGGRRGRARDHLRAPRRRCPHVARLG